MKQDNAAAADPQQKEGTNMTQFNELPADVRNEAKETLKAFDRVHVIFEHGKYHVSAGMALKNKYADDHRFVGTYYANEVFTEDERILNYVNEFQCFPIEYKGKRDYTMFHTGKREEFVMIDGDIVIKA